MATKYIVTQQFTAPRKDGVMMSYGPGKPYDVPAEVLEGRGHLFFEVDWPETGPAPVPEAATATPGKKRATRRRAPAKKAAPDGG